MLLTEAEKQAALLAEQVGPMSACGIRIAIDVYDYTGSTWRITTTTDANGWPWDTGTWDSQAFLEEHGYDTVFDAFPVGPPGRSYRGIAFLGTGVALFPIMSGSLGPSYLVLMHEWLHHVVYFYRDVVWPTNDVHGACEHGYVGFDCGLNPTYFADLMQGKVPENGRLLGIRPPDWLRDGTPTHPNRTAPVPSPPVSPVPPIPPVPPMPPVAPIPPFTVSGFDLPASVGPSGGLYSDQLAATVFTFQTNRPPRETPAVWLERFDQGWKQADPRTRPTLDASGTHGTISLAQLAPDGLATGSYRVAWSFPEGPTVSGASASFNVFQRPPALRAVTVAPRVSLRALSGATVSIVLDRAGQIDVRVDRLVGSRWRVVWWHFVDAQQETKLPLSPFVSTPTTSRLGSARLPKAGSYRILVSTQGSVSLDAAPSARFTLVK